MPTQNEVRSARRGGTTFTVESPAGPIRVVVTRKRVKNLNLRVRPDGKVKLSVPFGTPDAVIRDFLDRRSGWIASHVARPENQTSAGHIEHDEDRTTIPLWGQLVATADALTGADPSPAACSDTELDELIQKLYRRELEHALPEVAARAEQRLGVHAERWQIRRMTSRWGSCTPARRSIRISTMLAAYPPACLEMVVTHELVHIMEPSHNARFHALLDRYCPENRALARVLREPARTVAQAYAATRTENART